MGYYVDEGSGKVCGTWMTPPGCHFEYHDKQNHREIWIVADEDGEVLQEAVLWPSIEAMAAAGIDVSGFPVRTSSLSGPDLAYWVARANARGSVQDVNIRRQHYGSKCQYMAAGHEASQRAFVAETLGDGLPPRDDWQ